MTNKKYHCLHDKKKKQKKQKDKKIRVLYWRIRVSIWVPLAGEPGALPFELTPRNTFAKPKLLLKLLSMNTFKEAGRSVQT